MDHGSCATCSGSHSEWVVDSNSLFSSPTPLAQPAWLTAPLSLSYPGNEKQGGPRALRLPRVQVRWMAERWQSQMTWNMLQMPGVWFRSSWNYTLRAAPTLSASEPEPSLDLAEARTALGVSAQGRGAEQRGSKGRRQIPSWKSGTGIFSLCRHLWSFVRSFVRSFIQQGSQSVTQQCLLSCAALQPGTGSRDELGTEERKRRARA